MKANVMKTAARNVVAETPQIQGGLPARPGQEYRTVDGYAFAKRSPAEALYRSSRGSPATHFEGAPALIEILKYNANVRDNKSANPEQPYKREYQSGVEHLESLSLNGLGNSKEGRGALAVLRRELKSGYKQSVEKAAKSRLSDTELLDRCDNVGELARYMLGASKDVEAVIFYGGLLRGKRNGDLDLLVLTKFQAKKWDIQAGGFQGIYGANRACSPLALEVRNFFLQSGEFGRKIAKIFDGDPAAREKLRIDLRVASDPTDHYMHGLIERGPLLAMLRPSGNMKNSPLPIIYSKKSEKFTLDREV